VVVVGAGPAGAALAFLLARRGVRVTLVERQTDFAREFRGEALMPSGLGALEQMGLGRELAALPQVRLEVLEIFRAGRRIASVPIAGDESRIAGPRIVSQPAMLEMLVAEAARFPSFALERGSIARDLVRDREQRVVGLEVEGASGARTLRADLVIGADGRSSVLRRRAGARETRFRQAFDIVWCKVPLPDGGPAPPTARAFLGHGHAALAFPSYDDRLQIGWIIAKGSFGELRSRGVDAWIEALRAHVSVELGEHLARSRDRLTHPFVLDVVCDRVEDWTAPGLLLIGDAAHAMSPVGAQGINLALRDAIVAANRLVPVLATGEAPRAADVDAATRGVQAEREPEVIEIQRLQQVPPPILFGASWWSRFLIDRALPLLLRTGIAQVAALPTLRRLTSGVTAVRLAV
jgi:2-polyprenyl-6-methoxyphenol hydroxylase-like FAD-dependent oxidoreductase